LPIDVALSPFPTEAGVLVAAAIRDVTEYRRLEAELRRRTCDMEEADHRKDEFLATLAHELRSPLAALNQVGQLLRLPAADDRRVWAAGVVERQTGHMLRLVEDLLDVARVRRGKVTLRKEPTDLTVVAARAVEISRPLIEGRGQVLQVTPPLGSIWVEGDGMRLTQVVDNLLTNSAKFTPEGGRINLILAAEGGDAVLRVRDNGVGIPADMLTRVFDLFTQVHGAGDRAAGGLGIGLALVRRLVEMHRGTVVAESGGPGFGSEFIVRIPLLPDTKSI
jgi:signal transduction histidine kinase